MARRNGIPGERSPVQSTALSLRLRNKGGLGVLVGSWSVFTGPNAGLVLVQKCVSKQYKNFAWQNNLLGQVATRGDREVERGPPPPFTTSTLQQDANRRLGWPTGRTMSLAQDLFEGSNIENGEVNMFQ